MTLGLGVWPRFSPFNIQPLIEVALLFKTGYKASTAVMEEHRRVAVTAYGSYQSDLAYFLKDCRLRSWCVCGSAEIPCALRVLGPISWALGSTDWHLCSFLFSSWISSSLSASRLSKSRIRSSFSSRILAKSSSRSLMSVSALKLCNPDPNKHNQVHPWHSHRLCWRERGGGKKHATNPPRGLRAE